MPESIKGKVEHHKEEEKHIKMEAECHADTKQICTINYTFANFLK